MKFTISWCESKTSSKGTEYKRCSVIDESGRSLENVAVFNSFASYAAVMPGAVVEGALESKMFNGKESFSIVNMKGPLNQGSGGARGGSQMIKAIETKNANIEKNMESKQENIQKTGSFRDATLFVTTFYKDKGWNDEELEAKWEQWYQFFTNKYNQPF